MNTNLLIFGGLAVGLYMFSKREKFDTSGEPFEDNLTKEGLPHDRKILSASDLVLGMTWSSSSGKEWKLTEFNEETGRVMICSTTDKTTGTECKGMHFSILSSMQSAKGVINDAASVPGVAGYNPDPMAALHVHRGGRPASQNAKRYAMASYAQQWGQPMQFSGMTGLPFRSNPCCSGGGR